MKRKEKCVHVLVVALLLASASISVPSVIAPESVSYTTLKIDPASIIDEYNIDENFTVDIKVDNITGLYSWYIGVQWNPDILECTAADYVDTFLPDQAPVPGSYLDLPGTIDNTEGEISPPYSRTLTGFGNMGGVNGSGTLMQVTFQVESYGETWINFTYDTELLDSMASVITVNLQNCSFKLTGPEPPAASFTVSPEPHYVNEPITFNASSSQPGYNGTHDVSIANYTWDFGDGNVTTVDAPTSTVTHMYSSNGTFTVNLTVTCEDEPTLIANGITSDSTWQNITVTVPPSEPPVASFTVSPLPYYVNETVITFDASGSEDGFNGTHDVLIANYTWDFDDGNVTTVDAPTATITHVYSSAGNFTVNLTVTCMDDTVLISEGLTSDSAVQNITVYLHLFKVRNLNTGMNYTTIQEAINAPETLDGHTIFVDAGTYYERVVVNKSLNLLGADRDTTIINVNGTGDGVAITVDNVTVINFTIKSTGIGTGIDVSYRSNIIVKNTTVIGFEYGIYLRSSSGNTVSGNTVASNDYGVRLYYSSGNTVSGNTVTSNAYGVRLYYSSGNTVSGNTAASNDYGIYLRSSSGNTVSGNTVASNDYGVRLYYSSGNTVSGNTVTSNDYCIRLYYSSDNSIYHNNFMDNTNQVYNFESNNTWDDGYPSGGNYWSDYNGTDSYRGPYQNETGSDGIGDTPYVIDENNDDSYPLMEPWSSLQEVATNVTLSATEAYPTWEKPIVINVTVKNTGVFNKTFSVTVYYAGSTTPIGSQDVTVLTWNESRTLTFSWTLTSVEPCAFNYPSGRYVPYAITVNFSSPILGEINVTDGNVTVRRVGDVNGDGHCRGADFTLLGMSWWLKYGDPDYDWRADFNANDWVRFEDLTLLAMNWYEY